MSCIKCNDESESMFFSESYECKCGEMNIISYHVCPNCGWMWREVNGKLSEGSEVHMDRLKEFSEAFYNEQILKEDEQAIFDNLQEEINRMARVDSGNASSMSDYVHRCLRCREVAYEAQPGIFKCTNCGFEWEVVNLD